MTPSDIKVGAYYGMNRRTWLQISFGSVGSFLTEKPPALAAMNLRRLLLYIEKAVEQAVAHHSLAVDAPEPPDGPFTMEQLKGVVEAVLMHAKSSRALYGYTLVCDATNNPPFDNDGLWSKERLTINLQPHNGVKYVVMHFDIHHAAPRKKQDHGQHL